jgi:hypothetical protein
LDDVATNHDAATKGRVFIVFDSCSLWLPRHSFFGSITGIPNLASASFPSFHAGKGTVTFALPMPTPSGTLFQPAPEEPDD